MPTPFANVFSPCDQERDSVVAGRILPPPVRSYPVPSCTWPYGSVEFPRAHTASHLGTLPQAVAASIQTKRTMPVAHAFATGIESPHQSSTPSKLSELSRGKNEPPIPNSGLDSRLDPLQGSSRRASIGSAPDRSRSSHDYVKKPRHDEITTDKREKHTIAERKRRSVCSGTIMEIKTHLLPNLPAEASSTSHKSVVPRNDILVRCLANIVCLKEACDILANDYDEFFQKYERELHAAVEEKHRYKVLCTAAQRQLDALHDHPKGQSPGHTAPASSPPSRNTCKHGESGTSDDDNEGKPPLKRLRCSPDLTTSIRNRKSTWRSDVTNEIREFVENWRKITGDAQEPSKRKRKRSSSDSTV